MPLVQLRVFGVLSLFFRTNDILILKDGIDRSSEKTAYIGVSCFVLFKKHFYVIKSHTLYWGGGVIYGVLFSPHYKNNIKTILHDLEEVVRTFYLESLSF